MNSPVDRMLANPPKKPESKEPGRDYGGEEFKAEKEREKQFERDYKYNIIDIVARTLQPGWYDPKEKYSDEARQNLKNMAEDKAIAVLRAISKYIKEPH